MGLHRVNDPQYRTSHANDRFTAFYRERAPGLHGFLRAHYPDVPAGEVVDDTFSTAWETWNRIDTGTNVEANLREEASLRAEAYRRRHDDEQPRDGDLPLEPDRRDPERQILGRAYLADAGKYIDTLPQRTQVIVRLRTWYELKYRVIAEKNDMNEAAARQQGNRALSLLREQLKDAGYVVIAWVAAQFASKQHTPHSDISVSAHHAGTAATIKAASAALIVTASTSALIAISNSSERAFAVPDRPVLVTDAPASRRQTPLPHRHESQPATARLRESAEASIPAPKLSTPQVDLPARAKLHLSPDFAGGRQEKHRIEVDSPVETLRVEGERTATGPSSLYAVCQEQRAACPAPDPQSVNSTDRAVPPRP